MNSLPRLGRLLRWSLMGIVFFSSASFSATLDIQGGALFGAAGVDVNGVLYDVSFQDGICADLYDGCDQNSDFPFANPLDSDDGTLGFAANAALMNQVFIDSPSGAFDSNPELTNGCFATGGCQINTPLFLSQGGAGLGILWVFNSDTETGDILTGSGGGSAAFDSSIGFPDSNVYAVWSESAVVPVPAAAWLFGSALGLLGWMRRKAA